MCSFFCFVFFQNLFSLFIPSDDELGMNQREKFVLGYRLKEEKKA